ncbi:MAG TPA: RNA polymerase factor sigma-32 [Fredinandcohnia sp.]|nr:RNA polymerase factor sigma-32 [Fredinandcohnia sp.]
MSGPSKNDPVPEEELLVDAEADLPIEEETALVLAEEEPTTALSRTDPLARYMAEVSRHPVLSREEEHELAVRYATTGDLEAAYRLVTANLRLVVKIAYEYRRAAFNILDLIQEGNVGLMHAVRKYDPFKGVKLSTYASWWIRAYILRFIMDNWRMVKLGTTEAQRKLFFNLRKEQAKLAAEGFVVGPKLLAERLGVSEEDVVEMDRRLAGDEVWIDAPVTEDGDRSIGEILPAPSRRPDDVLGEEQIKAALREEMEAFAETLDERERFIFEKRLTADEPLTLQEIGDAFGISRERARQIEAKLVKGLRERLRERLPDLDWSG